MKHIIGIVLLLNVFITSCVEEQETKNLSVSISNTTVNDTLVEIPDRLIDKASLDYDNKISLWTINNQSYSGYAVSFYPDSTLKEKIAILDGKKENKSVKYYADGALKQIANYHKGKLHGEKKMWSIDTNHILISDLNYYLGKANGEQKQWYKTGELYKKLNLKMGREEGIQQAFRENGDLYANYEAKNGRIFGLKKASLCYGLEDENIKYGN